MFNKNTDELLLEVQLPSSQGITEVYRNAGRVVNNGIELGIGGDIIRPQSFKWTVNSISELRAQGEKEFAPGTTAVPKTYDGLETIGTGRT